jgi:tetratricopeptide (TPR) repeat protein
VSQPIASSAAAQQDAGTTDPDRLYADRARVPSALEAATIWEERLEGEAADFESAWKLARACYWLGGHVADNERRRQYERGIEAGRRAVALEPDRPEGHFWMAANMGAMAESFGIRAGLRYRGTVKRELETVLSLDPGYQQGSADRALGRWYLRVPGLLGGSKNKSVEHLQRSLDYDPGSAASHLFLAETFLKMNRREEAYEELQRVLDAPLHPEWVPEVLEFQEKARVLLEEEKLGSR